MVNSQLVKETSNAFKIDERIEKIPSPIPIVEVGCKFNTINLVKDITATNALSTTLYTTPTNQDFYLKNAIVSLKQISGGAATTAALTAVINAVRYNIVPFAIMANSANNDIATPNFNYLKIDRGTTITLTMSSAETNVKLAACIFGFVDEVE